MTLVILLLAIGIVLFFFEVIVPGGVLGTLGALCMLGGVVYAFIDLGVGGGMLTLLVALVALGAVLWIEFRILPDTRLGKRMFLHAEVSAGTQPAIAEPSIVGRSGEAATVLAPSGFVIVDGRRIEAYSQSGYVEAGAVVRVDAVDNFRIIVSKP